MSHLENKISSETLIKIADANPVMYRETMYNVGQLMRIFGKKTFDGSFIKAMMEKVPYDRLKKMIDGIEKQEPKKYKQDMRRVFILMSKNIF